MRVLLIWEALPEEVKLFVIEDPTEEQLSVLRGANGKYVGIDDYGGDLMVLNTAVGGLDCADPDVDAKWAGLWDRCEVECPITGPIDLVVRSGFVV